MADILIRMEMPKNCMVCDFRNRGFDLNGDLYCNCRITKENVPDYYNLRMENCPLHELPEHGDLIDVSKISLQEYEQAAHDALHNGKGSILYDCGVLAGARAITQLVRRAPVVIPSNKEETE